MIVKYFQSINQNTLKTVELIQQYVDINYALIAYDKQQYKEVVQYSLQDPKSFLNKSLNFQSLFQKEISYKLKFKKKNKFFSKMIPQ
ncbi:unnamed protein product [Paramecium sonneborni]|uniref:Uncharacterized protein n=1 Tax=Paramecium sonneborni TaxID=65129 RepID=A0A8S1N801_9CILI|nr:unnamed protein product [Paramecium sonneborni]